MNMNLATYKAVLIDDEVLALKNMKLALRDYTDIEIVGEAQTKDDARLIIENLRPDVVFLDINLLSSTGFELLDELNYLDFHLIFVTAHDEFALKAFEYSAANYLLKPLEKDKLDAAIQTLRGSSNAVDQDTLNKLFSLLQKSNEPQPSKIALPTPRGVVMRSIEDIVCFRSSGNYCFVHFEDGSKVLISKTMKELEAQFTSHNFFRIHHGVLINCGKVETYKHGQGEVLLDNGETFGVSFRRRANFLRHIKRSEGSLATNRIT